MILDNFICFAPFLSICLIYYSHYNTELRKSK
nr:MAG TPA: hypothetical protein [Caudoviricetes sp.]